MLMGQLKPEHLGQAERREKIKRDRVIQMHMREWIESGEEDKGTKKKPKRGM